MGSTRWGGRGGPGGQVGSTRWGDGVDPVGRRGRPRQGVGSTTSGVGCGTSRGQARGAGRDDGGRERGGDDGARRCAAAQRGPARSAGREWQPLPVNKNTDWLQRGPAGSTRGEVASRFKAPTPHVSFNEAPHRHAGRGPPPGAHARRPFARALASTSRGPRTGRRSGQGMEPTTPGKPITFCGASGGRGSRTTGPLARLSETGGRL